MATVRIQLRRGTSTEWTTADGIGAGVVLAAGEIGLETDTRRFKIGNEVDSWGDLPYANVTPAGLQDSLGDYVLVADVGAANGVVGLNSDQDAIIPGAAIIFEGDTANIYETTLTVEDPTADRTITIPNSSGTVVLSDASGNVNISGNLTVNGTTTTIDSTTIEVKNKFVFEGLTANSYETTLEVEEPTADRTITLPDETGTVALQSYVSSQDSLTLSNANSYTNNEITAEISARNSAIATAKSEAISSSNSYADTAVSTHNSDTTNVHGISDTANLVYQIDLTSHSSDTTNVHGIADTADLATKTYADTAVSTHSSDTTNVHGISDVADLATKDYADTAVSTHSSDTTNVHGIADTADLATKTYADTAVSTHSSDTTNVHGIADTADLATKTYADTAASTAESNANDYTDTAITTEAGLRSTAITNALSAAEDYTDGEIATEISARNSAIATAKGEAEGYADTQIGIHNSDTTNIHGIANTSDLATKSYVDTAEADAVSAAAIDATTKANNAQSAAEATASAALSSHESDTTNIHGITDTAELATKTFAAELLTNATKTNIIITGNKDGLTITAENGVADSTTTDLAEGTNLYFTDERAQDAVGNSVGTGLSYNDTTGSISVTANTYDAYGSASTVAGNLSSHESDTTTHGVSGDIVGTTDTQTISNKTLGSNLAAGGYTITGLAQPTQGQDAATKSYVDGVTEGLHIHETVKAATTTNITLASDVENGDTLDGVTLATGDRILIKNQTTKSENGIYVVSASGAPTRALDFDTPAEIDSGDFVFVDQGTANGNTGWVQTNVVGTVGTDDVEFTQFSGAGTYLAGTGLTLTGNSFSINTSTTVDTSTAQTLTNKTISLNSNTISGTLAEFNTAVTDADLASLSGTETLTNKTVNLSNNTLSGTIAEFNTALSDGNFATIAGTETLTNKTLTSPTVSSGLSTDTVSATSTVTAASLIPSGSTAPANGMFLPAANSVGIASNSIERIRFDSNGSIKLYGQVLEAATVSATAATGTINYDVITNENVLYYTSNASANWTLNIRGNSGTTLNSLMDTGQSLTLAFLVTNGSTAYYQTGFQIDGNAVTPKWQGGSAPTSGNTSSIDVYEIVIIKTGSSTFTVLEQVTKFA